MTVLIPESARQAMLDELTKKQDDANPFVQENGKNFMRYDRLCVIQRTTDIVDVEFLWRGMLVYTMHIACDFSTGQQLELGGIEGMTQCRLSSS